MGSIFNDLIRLFMIIGIVISRNVEANLINQWATHDQLLFQLHKFEDNKEFSGKFLHITDIHLDPYYLPNSRPSQICHRFARKPAKNRSGKFGTPDSDCDSPYALTNSTFLFLEENLKDVDFIIYTGDSLMHDRDPKIPLTEEYVKWCHETIVKYITDTFDMDRTKFIPTIGNNDEWDHNQLGRGPNSLFGNLTQIWAPLNLNLTTDFINGGYFRQDINSKLSVISVNSMYFYESNDQVKDCDHKKSPGAIQLRWIKNQLEDAKYDGRKVYIAQHIPPLDGDGEPSYFPACHVEYVQLIGNFSDVIVGHFTGHTNLDTLTFVTESENIDGRYSLYYLDKDEGPSTEFYQNIILVLNNAPSIYPAHNPGIREYRYSTSPETFGMLIDYVQYYLDIKKANKIGIAEWEIEYTASETYDMNRLLPSDWAQVLDKMSEDDEMWRSYFKYVTVSADF